MRKRKAQSCRVTSPEIKNDCHGFDKRSLKHSAAGTTPSIPSIDEVGIITVTMVGGEQSSHQFTTVQFLCAQVRFRSRGNPRFRRHGYTFRKDRRRERSNPAPDGLKCSVPNAPTFTGRDCHLQSSSNVVTLIRRAHAASAVFSSSLVTRTLHRVPSSTPRSLPFDRFVAAYNSYHCAPPRRSDYSFSINQI